MEFPARLKEIRILRKKQHRDVASALGIQTRSYQAYEGGTREPNLKTLIALADFFDVSLDYLVGRTDAGPKS